MIKSIVLKNGIYTPPQKKNQFKTTLTTHSQNPVVSIQRKEVLN